ncbi:MAG: YbhB/YbcL family Raf kinase inhibitor-like protein [Gemmatimonas sp.]
MTLRVWASAAALAMLAGCSTASAPTSPSSGATPRPDSLVVTMPGLPEGSFLAKKNEANTGACNSGGNVSPAIEWSRWPTTTKSFAVVVSDPDGGRGRGSTHWIAYNIPLSTAALAEGAGVAGATAFTQGKNSAGLEHYRGPCPAVGDQPHHYVFAVFALDVEPGTLPPGLDRAGFGAAVADHTVAYTSVVLRYAR